MDGQDVKYKVDEKLLAAAVLFSEDAIMITDAQLDLPGPFIIYVNPAFTRLTGYKPEEVLGRNPRFLQGANTDLRVLKRLRVNLHQGGVFYGLAINYRKDGSEFWMEWHIEPIRNDKGEITHYLAIQRDATARIEAQQTIEQKNSALKEILSQIEMEKIKFKESVVSNVEEVLLPALKKLRRKGTPLDKKYLDVLEKNLKDLTSSFGINVTGKKIQLSPREIEIANLIKNGLSSKDICEMLHLSFKTIETHRNKIRKKFQIVNKQVNLVSYLQSLA